MNEISRSLKECNLALDFLSFQLNQWTVEGYKQVFYKCDAIGQGILTTKYELKNVEQFTAMLRKLNRKVSKHYFGHQAMKNYPNQNKIEWISVLERNTDNDGLHAHLLLIKPNPSYMKPDAPSTDLKSMWSLIKHEWVKLGGGVIGESLEIEPDDNKRDLADYFFKQFNMETMDADRIDLSQVSSIRW